MDNQKKSDILFEKGMECYNLSQYKEALKYFEACIKYSPNDRADLFIKVCKNNIPTETNKKTNNDTKNYKSNYHKSYSAHTNYKNFSKENSYSSQSSSTKSDDFSYDKENTIDDDKKCKELLKKKDYYDLLNIQKNATQEEIKKGYKKQAIKFHPDKNRSKLAEECFKKISEAYQILSIKEKKEFYDKYGNEAEFKEKYYKKRKKNYYEEEMDPFDAFNVFFGGYSNRTFYTKTNRNKQRKNYNNNHREYHHNVNINNNNNSKMIIFSYFLPLFIVLIYLIPSISYFMKQEPLYQFRRNAIYSHKRRTSINFIEFYVSEKFVKKYPKMKDFKSLEPIIEKKYLYYLYQDCSQVIQTKNQLQYYMAYGSRYQKEIIKNKLAQLNFNSCQMYNKLKYLIR